VSQVTLVQYLQWIDPPVFQPASCNKKQQNSWTKALAMKIICAYLKGLLKHRKMAFSFLKYLFSFQRYWHFSIMQIRSVMTSFCLRLKSGKCWINDISGNIEAVFLKLGATNVHHKRNKMTPLVLLPWQQFCHWWRVNKNKNSQFCLETKTIYPTQSNDGSDDNMGTMSVLSKTLCLTSEVANGDIYNKFFDRKRLEPK